MQASVSDLLTVNDRLIISTQDYRREEAELKGRLEQLRQLVSAHTDMVNIAHVIMGALLSPRLLNNSDLEELTRLVIYARQRRLGINPGDMKCVGGQVVCECRVPMPYFEPGDHNLGPDDGDVLKKLALSLIPLVKEEFVPRREWETEQLARLIIEQREMTSKLPSFGK